MSPTSPSSERIKPNLVLIGANEGVGESASYCSERLRILVEELRQEVQQKFGQLSVMPAQRPAYGKAWMQAISRRIPGFRYGVQETDSSTVPLEKLQSLAQLLQDEIQKARSLVIVLCNPDQATDYATATSQAIETEMLKSPTARNGKIEDSSSIIVMPKVAGKTALRSRLMAAIKASENLSGRMAFMTGNKLLALPGLQLNENGEFSSLHPEIAHTDSKSSNWYFNQSRDQSQYPQGIEGDSLRWNHVIDSIPLENIETVRVQAEGVVITDNAELNGARDELLMNFDQKGVPGYLVARNNPHEQNIPLRGDTKQNLHHISDVREGMTGSDARVALARKLGNTSSYDGTNGAPFFAWLTKPFDGKNGDSTIPQTMQ